MRRLAREAAVFALYLGLALAMTWPLARHLDTALADLGDPLVNVYIIDWVCHALTHAPFDVYHAPTYYPTRYALAHSENLIGVALLVLPFHLAGLTPITLYNIALLLGFALSGYGAFVLARVITRSTSASLVAGVVFAFVSFKFDHVTHLQMQWSCWIPLLLAALLVYWRGASRLAALAIGAAFVMNGLTNIHYFLFGSLTAVITVGVLAILDPRRGRRFWTTLAAAFVIGGIVLLPFLLPYRYLAKEHGAIRSEGEARSGSAPAHAWLVTTPNNIVYGALGKPEWHVHEMQLFPGLVAILLGLAASLWRTGTPACPPRAGVPTEEGQAGVPVLHFLMALLAGLTWLGIVTDRVEWTIFGQRIASFDSADVPATLLVILLLWRLRFVLRDAMARSRFTPEAWAAAAWIIIGVVGSLGMNAFFHAFLFRRAGVFQAVRAPVRWAIVAYVGIAVWAALGALVVTRRHKVAMTALLIALLAIDYWPRKHWERAMPAPAPVYRWLAKEKIEPLFELPMGSGMDFSYLYGSTTHHLRQFNGVGAFGQSVPSTLRQKTDALQYDDELLAILERHGGRLIVVHAHALAEHAPHVRAWLAKHIAGGRLAYLRKFEHEIEGDFVFAVTKNFADWRRLREPDVPDGAGHMPDEKLARMLAGQTTHSNAIIAVIDGPQPGELVRGPLRVRGWVLSPFIIRRVTILLHNETIRIEAPLIDPRPEIKQKYSWYYFVPQPGFDAIVPRPDHIRRASDVQVEIEDEGGRVTRTRDVLFDWEAAP